MCFEECSGFFHPWFKFDPVGFAANEYFGESTVIWIAENDVHDVRGFEGVGHAFDFFAGGVAEFNPCEFCCGSAWVYIEARANFCNI